MDIKKLLVYFTISFIILWIIYYFFIIKKCKKNNGYVPAEVNIILYIYRIDYRKINVYSMVKVVSLITVFSLSFMISIVLNMTQDTVLALILGTVFSLMFSFCLYMIVGNYYSKKR